MVFDSVGSASLYKPLGPRMDSALSFIQNVRAGGFTSHKEEIQGDNLFALFQDTTTKPAEGRHYEAHRKYIDLQFVVSGEEIIRVRNVSQLSETDPYDADRDIAFYQNAPGNDIHLRPGDFLILFPHDAHLPLIPPNTPGEVKKVVVKVCV